METRIDLPKVRGCFVQLDCLFIGFFPRLNFAQSRPSAPNNDGMDLRLWTGESGPLGKKGSPPRDFPRPMRKAWEEISPPATLAVERRAQPKRIRVPPAAVPAAKDGPGDGNVAGVVISLPQRFADNR